MNFLIFAKFYQRSRFFSRWNRRISRFVERYFIALAVIVIYANSTISDSLESHRFSYKNNFYCLVIKFHFQIDRTMQNDITNIVKWFSNSSKNHWEMIIFIIYVFKFRGAGQSNYHVFNEFLTFNKFEVF